MSGQVAMLHRGGKRSSPPKCVQVLQPTRDWQEECEWKQREAMAKHPCLPGTSGLSMSLVEEPLRGTKDIWPSKRSLWWRRLIAHLPGWENPYMRKECLCTAKDNPCMVKVDPKPACRGEFLSLGRNLQMFRKR